MLYSTQCSAFSVSKLWLLYCFCANHIICLWICKSLLPRVVEPLNCTHLIPWCIYGGVYRCVICSRCWGGLHWPDPVIRPCKYWEGTGLLLWVTNIFPECEPSTWHLFAVVPCLFPFADVENALSLILLCIQNLVISFMQYFDQHFWLLGCGRGKDTAKEEPGSFSSCSFLLPGSSRDIIQSFCDLLLITHCTAELYRAEQLLLLPL